MSMHFHMPDTQDTDEIVNRKTPSPCFGGINLEDIAALNVLK